MFRGGEELYSLLAIHPSGKHTSVNSKNEAESLSLNLRIFWENSNSMLA